MIPAAGLVSLAWAVACLVCTSSGEPDKSRDFSCQTFKPAPGGVANNVDPEIHPSPFRIILEEAIYHKNRPGYRTINGQLVATGGRTFHSFILGAYRYQDKRINFETPEGTLKLLEPSATEFKIHKTCNRFQGNEAHAIRSLDMEAKRVIHFQWTANTDTHGHIEFRASFIEDSTHYWVAEQSEPVKDLSDNTKLPRMTHSIPRITTEECGSTKGCFREPANCEETQCLYILTWKPSRDVVEFELGGLADNAADRYVAVGMSDDKYMGNDNVFTCAHNSATDTTEVYLSYNQVDPKRNTPIKKYDDDNVGTSGRYDGVLTTEDGSYTNARLRCRFTVKRDLDNMQLSPQMNSIRGDPVHLLFANGFASRGMPSQPWLRYEELPGASEDKVDLGGVSGDHSGWASFPMAKAHGILMILAWILFASIGLLLTKYYKTMWPNKRTMFDSKFWFFGHFTCMSMVFMITLIAIILIFIETGGYSQAPDLPHKAHPILGIIIFVCIIINPIIALIRPGEDSYCRPVFNWFHWAFGTIANVLAIPTIFIGMDFGKVMVPWWATWILVIWVIFHIIVELTLEIHQCCTYKKNKERRKKWEQAKREYPKQVHPEPEPVGRRFKRFMLSLHVCVTILITLIMIIIIAVS